jgi:hypothetical protein
MMLVRKWNTSISYGRVKVISITPIMHDTRDCPGTGHMENVSLRYAKITWKILDGNIQYTDAWNERYSVGVKTSSAERRCNNLRGCPNRRAQPAQAKYHRTRRGDDG